MTEINFSIYGQGSILEDHSFLLKKFEDQHHMHIQVSRMEWNDAWSKLLNYSLHGGSPDISHIGSIWTSSLVGMEVLRPFTQAEIKTMGGTEAFFKPCWDNSMFAEESKAWGIPFGAYLYVILYRRDLLQQAGIDEQTAFASETAMLETIECLRASGVHSPFALASGMPYRPRVHIAASWVWGAGGDYISSDGQDILFDQPAGLSGLKNFFELYRNMARSEYNLPAAECMRRFAQGDSAITIVGCDTFSDIQRMAIKGHMFENIGIATLPGATWVGGADIIMWKETHLDIQKEQLALALAQYLTGYEAQLKYANAVGSIPARVEVLPYVQYALPGANEAFAKALSAGRAYQPVRLWVRFLGELSNAFDHITAEILEDPALDLDQTLLKYLIPLAEKFRLVLRR